MSVSFRFLFLSALLLSLVSCSKPGGTKAGVKLNVSGISALSATAGSGGTILFGRSTNGDLFGKIINGTEDILNVPNGDWMFYALMWDTNASGLPLNDKVFCAKVPAKLSGTDTSLTFNLSNSNCTDADFSNGKYYTSGGLVRFADVFLEECDDINATTNWFCGIGNQGSALSYRLKFQNFNKPGNGPFGFGAEAITSACKKVAPATPSDDIMNQGLPVNFPSGNGLSPFVVSVEFFVGTNTCDTTDAKGVHTVFLNNGLGSPAAIVPSKVLTSTTNCSFSTPDYPADQIGKQNLCEAYYGSWTGSTCNSVPLAITRFAPTCSSQVPGQTPAIKHLMAMPKPFLCDRYVNSSSQIGGHPFAGGNGTTERPFKICTEWQLNQIGEKTALVSYASSSYKLMNSLDMNKTDFGPYAKPQCVGVTNSLIDLHQNFNPLDRVSADCTTFDNSTSFTGTFDGNNRVISNIRIDAKTVAGLGFVKFMSGTGRIRNLILKEVEVRGKNNIGAIAGIINGTNNLIVNVFVEKVRAEAKSNNNTDGNYAGGIAGTITYNTTNLINVHVNDSDIRGRDYIGGLVGQNSGQIQQAHFRGQISTDESSASAIGGLVGRNMTGANIKNSYSEGAVTAGSTNSGGISGLNSGTITSVYSTMTVDSYLSGATNIGGIVGDNTGGTVADVLFDGVLSYSGNGGTPTMNGVFVVGSGGTNCYSTVSPASGACSVLTSSSIRTALPTFTTPADWISITGSIPRQAWEQRDCLLASNQISVAGQVSSIGRGGESNPVIICNANQLNALSGRASTEYYKIADDINLSSWTSPSSTVSTFNGQLNGAGKILYGLNLTYVVGDNPTSYEGIFRTVSSTGVVANLKLYNNVLSNTAGLGDLGSGLLAGENLGMIGGIEILNSKVMGETNIGLAVGHNKNLLKKITVEQGRVSGKNSTGGIAGTNASGGSIIKSRADVRIDNSMSGTFDQFGGIAGTNSGSLDQISFDGELTFTAATSAPNGLRAGGITGLNTGSITNALADNRARIKAADTHVVGGLIGESTGSVNLSVSLGKLIYSNAGLPGTASDYFHPVVGFNNGGTIGSYVYYLENKIASYRNSASTSAACVGDGSTNCTVGTAPVAGSDMFDLSFGGGGGSLSTLVPMAFSTTNITYTGANLAASTQLDFFSSYALSDTTDSKTLTDLTTFVTYCPGGFTNVTGTGACTGGFDIAQMGGIGGDRILEYFKSTMYNSLPPANTPVWEFSTDEGPRLLQLHD